MRLKELDKRPVVDLSTATTVARLSDAGIDVAGRRVTGFSVRKAPGHQTWLPWERLHALGPDAATIDQLGALGDTPPEARPLRDSGAVGRRVLTDQGIELAALADIGFDPETGALTELVLSDGQVLPADALVGVGSYASVVRAGPSAGGTADGAGG